MWNNLENIFNTFDGYQILTDRKHWIKKNYSLLQTFVDSILDKCCTYNPSWITIPQLPLVADGSRNKINIWLAEATGNWITKKNNIKLILPVIITNTNILTKKPLRDQKLKLVSDCYRKANASGIWIVDNTLSDQNRNENFSLRYAKLIEFHNIVNKQLVGNGIKIAGPYWGINIVLWARGICDYPAICLGTSYTYYISCGVPYPGNVRLAITPLKRLVTASGLKIWLDTVIKKMNPDDPAVIDFEYLSRNYHILSQRESAINQVSQFYKKWLDSIEAIPKSGRALGLYQDLSSAFVLGKQLPELPKSALPYCSAKAREAGKTAEQLMLNCF